VPIPWITLLLPLAVIMYIAYLGGQRIGVGLAYMGYGWERFFRGFLTPIELLFEWSAKIQEFFGVYRAPTAYETQPPSAPTPVSISPRVVVPSPRVLMGVRTVSPFMRGIDGSEL